MEVLSNPLINKAELARLLFPNQKHPEQYLNDKIFKRYGKRITPNDEKKIKNIFSVLFDNLNK